MATAKKKSESASLKELIGDPEQVDADLQQFRKDTELLSKRSNLVSLYPKRWVAIFDGAVRADALSITQLMSKVDGLKLPRDKVVVRYVDRNLRRMIL